MVGDIRWSSCTVGWRGLWGSLGGESADIRCIAYGDLLSGQSDLDEFDTQRPLCESRRTSVRLSLRHAALLGSPVAQATPSPRSIALIDAMSASSI